MGEKPFEVETSDGVTLVGHIGGNGSPALLLHGGPGLTDYTHGCAEELANLFTTIRYTQRGVAPSGVQGPYTVESHMTDALAVLDAFQLQKAWVIGHSWGGHLALHLAVAHPDRILGVVCIDTLGASNEVFDDFRSALTKDLTPEQLARFEEIEAREEAGEVTEAELVEAYTILWPAYFFDPGKAPEPPPGRGVECSAETFASVMEHFEAKTLEEGLPKLRGLTVLFVHGIEDPLPLRASLDTAKLIRGARVARVPRCGHLPWIEQPGFTNRALRGLIAQL
ncbi:MAG TPA: alpha/beta hydrolase [Gaiellaceae bacterium]|nr:alpha/beta hydrolase [Gaiellaceae bacterium]